MKPSEVFIPKYSTGNIKFEITDEKVSIGWKPLSSLGPSAKGYTHRPDYSHLHDLGYIIRIARVSPGFTFRHRPVDKLPWYYHKVADYRIYYRTDDVKNLDLYDLVAGRRYVVWIEYRSREGGLIVPVTDEELDNCISFYVPETFKTNKKRIAEFGIPTVSLETLFKEPTGKRLETSFVF